MDQVTQVRGFADQRLRKPEDPFDPSNWGISLIVQYFVKNNDEEDAKPSAGSEPKKSEENNSAAPQSNQTKKE